MRSPTNAVRRSAASRTIVLTLAVMVAVGLVAVQSMLFAKADDAADKAPKGVYQCKIFTGRIHPHDNDDKWRQELEKQINDWYVAHPDIQYVVPLQTQGGDDPSVQAVTYTVTYQQK